MDTLRMSHEQQKANIDYSSLTDFEINKLVAPLAGYELYKDGICVWNRNAVVVKCWDDAIPRDWCNNIEHTWPVMLRYKISVIAGKDGWLTVPHNTVINGWTGEETDFIYSGAGFSDRNPLRAAMLTLLMMKDKTRGE